MLINLFQIPQGDKSVFYLGQIFGNVGSVLPVENPMLLVGIMFKWFNTLALTIGAFLIVYVTVVGLLKTAQEGEFLGKQWNSLWVPMRTVLGVAALFPTSTGYSAIQILIMWIILQGVGAADTMWTKVLQFLAAQPSHSLYAGVPTGGMNLSGVKQNMGTLFSSLMCQASAKANYAPIQASNGKIQYYCNINPKEEPFCTDSDADMLDPVNGTQVTVIKDKDGNPINNVYNMGPSNQCGSLTYCNIKATCEGKTPDTNSDSAGCFSCKAQQAVFQTIVATLGKVANQIVSIDNDYANFYEKSTDTSEIPGWIQSYCTASKYTPKECCTDPKTCTPKQFPPDQADPSTRSYSDTSSDPSSTAAPAAVSTALYLAYPLKTFVNGNDFVDAGVGEYSASISGAVSSYIESQMSKVTLSSWMAEAEGMGWIMAGAYYYRMAGENQNNQTALYPTFTVAPMTTSNNSVLTGYRTNFNAVNNLIKSMTSSNEASNNQSFTKPPEGTGQVSAVLDDSAYALFKSWQDNLTNNAYKNGPNIINQGTSTNPLISVATFGYQMMIVAQLMFGIVVTLVFSIAALGSINVIALGFGLTENILGAGFKAILSIVGPFFVILVGALYSIGALLGVYVPLIPYMIFTLGAIGWLIGTVEAMIAGPIIALGILSPGGQHDILGKAEPALMQLLNLFLRPVLMVVGLIVAMMMAMVVVDLINSGFKAIISQAIAKPGLFEQILFISAYTMFIVTALNKAFSLIHVLPERITTWIGGHAVSYGEDQALGETKGAVTGGASQIGKGAKHAEAGNRAFAGKMEGANKEKAEKADQEKKKKDPSVSGQDAAEKKPEGGEFKEF